MDLDINQADIKGNYTITIGDDKETVPVNYSNGKLNYGSEVTSLYDEEILNLMVSEEIISLPLMWEKHLRAQKLN